MVQSSRTKVWVFSRDEILVKDLKKKKKKKFKSKFMCVCVYIYISWANYTY